MTAMMAATVKDDELFTWDTPVVQVMPQFQLSDAGATTKPQAKEMAIVMLSDSTEAAARAYSQEEDPTAEGLEHVVDTVVAEKVDDGQLDDSALTFGDLTTIKAELVRALMGYYHARLPYPGFPGPKPIEEAGPKGLPEAAVSVTSEAEE